MNNIIAFEGMPGAGKTTAINRILRSSLLSKCIAFPQIEINPVSEDGLVSSKAYLYAEISKSNKINNFIDKYDHIFLDRTYLTTLAYCYARSKINRSGKEYSELLKYFKHLDNEYDIVRPTHLFYLHTSISTSIKRRSQFSHIDKFHNWFNPEFLKYFSEFYNENIDKFNIPKLTLIDTTKLSKEDVYGRIIEIF